MIGAIALPRATTDDEVAHPVDATVHVCAEVRDVSLAFGGHHVLGGVSLELRTGELVLLRGENGSGKTTLLNVISGYLAPDRGAVRLCLNEGWVDPSITSPESLARHGLGRLWQDIRLFPTLTVLDNVLAATPRMLGENPLLAIAALSAVHRQEREAKARAMRNLAIVSMEERGGSSCDMLSVGQMKRVALARLLQMESSLLLLDEPLAGLDAHSATALVRDLDRLRTEQGKTLLVVEHRHERVAGIADRILFLRNGRLEETGVFRG